MAFTSLLGIQTRVPVLAWRAGHLPGYLASLILEFWRQDTRGGKNTEGARGSSALLGA